MNLLIYCDDPEMGGVGHHCVALMRAALSQGWGVSYSQPCFDHPLLREMEAAGVRTHWISYNTTKQFARSLSDATEPARILETAKPDLIIFADCCHVSNLAAKHVAITRGIPFIVICHSAATYIAKRFASCLPVVRSQFARAAEVIAVSEMTLDVTRTYYGLNSARGIVIHSGRPSVFFEPKSEANRRRIRGELGISESAVVCLTTARITEEKGFGLQFRALGELQKERQLGSLQFIWAGNGPLLPMLRQALEAQGLDRVVRCLGHRNAVYELYDAADVFVLPTLHEAFGLSIAEAMAKGLAVIASRVEGIPEVMGDTGVYLPNPTENPDQTVAALKKHLVALGRDRQLIADLGVRGNARAAALFTEDRMLSRFAATIADTWKRVRPMVPAAPSELVSNS